MLIPLGILAGSGGAVGDYELIESYILGSAQSTVTFSSLATYASTYKHLQIRYTSRSQRSGFSLDPMALRFNGDSGNNYANHHLAGDGSSVTSYAEANTSLIYVVGSSPTAPTGTYGAGVIDILDAYSTTKNKTARLLHGTIGGSNISIRLGSGVRLNTEAISSLSITTFLGTTIDPGSRFSLYGIR